MKGAGATRRERQFVDLTERATGDQLSWPENAV